MVIPPFPARALHAVRAQVAQHAWGSITRKPGAVGFNAWGQRDAERTLNVPEGGGKQPIRVRPAAAVRQRGSLEPPRPGVLFTFRRMRGHSPSERAHKADSNLATPALARTEVFDWVMFYNRTRVHTSLEYVSPEESERAAVKMGLAS